MLESRLVFWIQSNHPGDGTLQLPPMPEEPIISQVGPSGACSIWRTGRSDRRLDGDRCEGGMDLGE